MTSACVCVCAEAFIDFKSQMEEEDDLRIAFTGWLVAGKCGMGFSLFLDVLQRQKYCYSDSALSVGIRHETSQDGKPVDVYVLLILLTQFCKLHKTTTGHPESNPA